MTREEAIKELSYIADEMPSMECGDWKEAIDMEIKALEQEPCEDTVSRKEIIEHYTTGEMANVHHIDKNHLLAFVEQLPPVRPQPCEDCISRQAVLEIAKQHTLTNDYLAIQNLPSVTPQPKIGHWIMDRIFERRTCDNCNKEYRWNFYPHNYCPNCGVKMVEPQEKNESR